MFTNLCICFISDFIDGLSKKNMNFRGSREQFIFIYKKPIINDSEIILYFGNKP